MDDKSSPSHQGILPVVNEKSESILRNLIHQQLDEIRQGNAFVEYELDASCVDDILTDDNIYTKFVTMTAKKWMEVDLMDKAESGLNGGKLNKKKKQYVTAIRAEPDFVRREIEAYKATPVVPPVTATGVAGGEGALEDSVSSLSESKVSSSSHKRKKKSKKKKKKHSKEKKKSKKSRKRKRDQQEAPNQSSSTEESSDADHTDGDGSRTKSLVHRETLEERKAEFEKEKRKLLKRIPEKIKRTFKHVGFSKWSKTILPVLYLGPYHVPPGQVRETYEKMLDKVRNEKLFDFFCLYSLI